MFWLDVHDPLSGRHGSNPDVDDDDDEEEEDEGSDDVEELGKLHFYCSLLFFCNSVYFSCTCLYLSVLICDRFHRVACSKECIVKIGCICFFFSTVYF